MAEVNLLDRYPYAPRPIAERGKIRLAQNGWMDAGTATLETTEDLLVEQTLLHTARKFGREYFDGDRLFGYGGYRYDPKFWTETAQRIYHYYNLAPDARILDVGCAKGYLLHDFQRQYPRLTVTGLDISPYAIEHAHPEVRQFLQVGNATSLPFPDKSFDLVISLSTVSNPPPAECRRAIREISRVSRQHAFITGACLAHRAAEGKLTPVEPDRPYQPFGLRVGKTLSGRKLSRRLLLVFCRMKISTSRI